MSPLAKIYDREHYITVKPPPPLKAFINIRNCKLKESWQSFGPRTPQSSTPAIIDVTLLSQKTPATAVYCAFLNERSSVCEVTLFLLVFIPQSHLNCFIDRTYFFCARVFPIIRFYCLHPSLLLLFLYHHANKAHLKQNENSEELLIAQPQDNTNHEASLRWSAAVNSPKTTNHHQNDPKVKMHHNTTTVWSCAVLSPSGSQSVNREEEWSHCLRLLI